MSREARWYVAWTLTITGFVLLAFLPRDMALQAGVPFLVLAVVFGGASRHGPFEVPPWR